MRRRQGFDDVLNEGADNRQGVALLTRFRVARRDEGNAEHSGRFVPSQSGAFERCGVGLSPANRAKAQASMTPARRRATGVRGSEGGWPAKRSPRPVRLVGPKLADCVTGSGS